MRVLFTALAVLLLSAGTAPAWQARQPYLMCGAQASGPDRSTVRVNHTFNTDGGFLNLIAWWQPKGNDGEKLGPIDLTVVYEDPTPNGLGAPSGAHVVVFLNIAVPLEGGRIILTAKGRSWSAPIVEAHTTSREGRFTSVAVVDIADAKPGSTFNNDFLSQLDRLGRVKVLVEGRGGVRAATGEFDFSPKVRDRIYPGVWEAAALAAREQEKPGNCVKRD